MPCPTCGGITGEDVDRLAAEAAEDFEAVAEQAVADLDALAAEPLTDLDAPELDALAAEPLTEARHDVARSGTAAEAEAAAEFLRRCGWTVTPPE